MYKHYTFLIHISTSFSSLLLLPLACSGLGSVHFASGLFALLGQVIFLYFVIQYSDGQNSCEPPHPIWSCLLKWKIFPVSISDPSALIGTSSSVFLILPSAMNDNEASIFFAYFLRFSTSEVNMFSSSSRTSNFYDSKFTGIFLESHPNLIWWKKALSKFAQETSSKSYWKVKSEWCSCNMSLTVLSHRKQHLLGIFIKMS